MRSNYGYLHDGTRVTLNDTPLNEVPEGAELKGAKGYVHSLLVFKDGECIGWILTEKLGFASTREWLNSKQEKV